MQLLDGAIQHYAWGTTDAIAALLHREPDGTPFAEYWLGAHPAAPATTASGPLDAVIRDHPDVLGQRSLEAWGDRLPFLMKILSARQPLSLQAHPTREQAVDGFARENAARIRLDDPRRVYSDDWPKPEILIPLEDFDALTGFREPHRTAELFAGLGIADELASVIGPLTERKGPAALAEVFLDALSLEGERAHLIDVTCAAAMKHSGETGDVGDFARTAVLLDDTFPGDRGILAALLLNRVTLHSGEAIYLAAGQMHAYLRGTGIEVMAASDNVVRGGLTAKHIDVAELVKVVDFTPVTPGIIKPETVRQGVERYATPCQEFDVWRMTPAPGDGGIRIPGANSARVVLVVAGTTTVLANGQSLALDAGQSAFLTAAETDAALTGDGVAFVTASGLR